MCDVGTATSLYKAKKIKDNFAYKKYECCYDNVTKVALIKGRHGCAVGTATLQKKKVALVKTKRR